MANYSDVFGTFTVPPAEATYSQLTLTESGALAWADNFSGEVANEHLATNILEVSASAPGIQLLLPPANEVSVGQDLMIRNIGAQSVEFSDAEGNPVTTILTGEAKYLYITVNTTAAGQWSMFTYGTGTSGADAALLAGAGLQQSAGNKIEVSADHRAMDSDYSIVAEDRGMLLNATVGSLILTTPDATAVPAGFYCFVKNSSLGMLALEGFGAQTVDGGSSKSLSPGDSVVLLKADEDWVTVGFGQSVNFTFSELVINAAAGDATLSSTDVSGRMIRVTGTATQDIVLTLPSVDNIYFVTVEGGMGAYTVTFKSAGGSVVVLNANEKTALYSDGLNVSIAITTTVTSTLSLTDGAAVAPSLFFSLDTDTGLFRKTNNVIGVATGGVERATFTDAGLELQSPLAVAQGGTGATSAVNALANLGATTNTRIIAAGDGLTGGGDLTENRTISMGTPSTLSTVSTNLASGTTHTHAITFPIADDTIPGIVSLATNAETQAGVDATVAVTPAGLNSRAASESLTGLIALANVTEVATGTNHTKAVTPAGLVNRTATEIRTGLVELATISEATAGVDTLRAVTPAGLKAALLTAFPVGSIYITAGNTNPGTFLGGTWVAMAGGRVMMNAGSNGTTNYTAGEWGGVESVVLDTNQMPSHNHGGATGTISDDHSHFFSVSTSSAGSHVHRLINMNYDGTNGPYVDQSNKGVTASASDAMEAAGDHTHSVSGSTGGVSSNHTHAISFQGGGAAHENRMPYMVVHFWRRTA